MNAPLRHPVPSVSKEQWRQTTMKPNANELRKHRGCSVDAQMPGQAYSHGGMCDWLRRTFPHSTGYAVEAATAIPAATVEGWFTREYKPSLPHFMRMLAVFGPSFAASSLMAPPQWLSDVERRQRITETENEIERLRAEQEKLKGTT